MQGFFGDQVMVWALLQIKLSNQLKFCQPTRMSRDQTGPRLSGQHVQTVTYRTMLDIAHSIPLLWNVFCASTTIRQISTSLPCGHKDRIYTTKSQFQDQVT